MLRDPSLVAGHFEQADTAEVQGPCGAGARSEDQLGREAERVHRQDIQESRFFLGTDWFELGLRDDGLFPRLSGTRGAQF